MRLTDALSALPRASFEALVRRRGVTIDPQKRLAPTEQAARALAMPRDLAGEPHWPDDVRAAVRLLAASPAGVAQKDLGGAVLPLVDAALVFPVPGAPGTLALPTEYRVQLPATASDDPRSARLLVASLDDETLHLVAGHYLGRMPSVPRAMVLAEVLERLDRAEAIEEELGKCTPRERSLLASIEARGGGVTTAELLDLSREPVRVTTPGTGAVPRRSTAHALLRRGFVLPVADTFAVPTEVAAVIGRDRRAAAAEVQREVASRVMSSDLLPSRARLSRDPGPPALALLCGLRAHGATPVADAGASRTAVRRAARDSGVDPGHAEILVSVARAAGLATATVRLAETAALLFGAWRRGGAWDEARVEEDRFRAGDKLGRIPTPTGALRSACLDVLEALPAGRFALLSDVVAAVLADLRASGAEHALARAAEKAPAAFDTSPESVVRHVLLGSLTALGALDRGASEDGEVARLSARARRWLGDPPARTPAETGGSEWASSARLHVAPSAPAATLVALSDAANVIYADGELYLEVTPETLERAMQRGVLLDAIRDRLLALAGELDGGAERAIGAVARARVPCELLRVAGYLVLPDERLRDALLADERARELFVVPSPPGALLVREGVAEARLGRAVRRLGGELATTSPAKRNTP